jgi:vacuolar iron transporter family protein
MSIEPGDEVGHVHQDVSGGWLRPAVFGAMDGLGTNIALIAGVSGSGAGAPLIVLTGMAGLVAGAFSMALREYASVETQNNSVRAEVQVERDELSRHPSAEQAELVASFMRIGPDPRDQRSWWPRRCTPTRRWLSGCTSTRSSA